jgi:hypothetical protein
MKYFFFLYTHTEISMLFKLVKKEKIFAPKEKKKEKIYALPISIFL